MDRKKKSLRGRMSDYAPSDDGSLYEASLMIDINDENSKASEVNASSPSTVVSGCRMVPEDAASTEGESEKRGRSRSRVSRRSTRRSKKRVFSLDSESCDEDDTDDEFKDRPKRKVPKRTTSMAKRVQVADDMSGAEDNLGSDAESEAKSGTFEVTASKRRQTNATEEVCNPGPQLRIRKPSGAGSDVQPGGGDKTDDTQKPAEKPTCINANNVSINEETSDNNCWICHKGGEVLLCLFCPRVYHKSCVQLVTIPDDDWLCPECQAQLIFESSTTMPTPWRTLPNEILSKLLHFLVDKMEELNCALHFKNPVDLLDAPDYMEYIFKPMDLSTLKKNIENGEYKSPYAFMSDFKWIIHNCTVFNGNVSLLTQAAKNLNRVCKREITEMIACPDCYLAKVKFQTDDDPDPEWFVQLCRTIHPLVWVRLRNFPLWPAKVIAMEGDALLARFFGDYDTNTVPIGSVHMHAAIGFSRDRVVNSRSERNPQFMAGYDEFRRHLTLIHKRYPDFQLPPIRQNLSQALIDQYYTHLGQTKRPASSVPPVAPSYQVTRISDMKLVASAAKKPGTPTPPAVEENSNTSQQPAKTKSPPAVDDTVAKENGSTGVNTSETESAIKEASVPSGPAKSPQEEKSKEASQPPSRRPTGEDLQPMEVDDPSEGKDQTGGEETAPMDVSSPSPVAPVLVPIGDQNQESGPTLTGSTSELVEQLFSRWEDRLGQLISGLRQEASSLLSCPPKSSSSTPTLAPPIDKPSLAKLAAPEHKLASSDGEQSLTQNFSSDVMSLPLGKALALLSGKMDGSIAIESDTEASGALQASTAGGAPGQPTENGDDDVIVVNHEKGAENNTSAPAPAPPPSHANHSLVLNHHHSPSRRKRRGGSTGLSAEEGGCGEENEVCACPEVVRLRREMRRLEVWQSVKQMEMSRQTQQHLIELRAGFECERTRLLEEARRIWEGQVVALVDAVKKKQWCSFCGRGAFYYCCWNTCYCNSECQERHWATHMAHCAQAKRPTQNPGFRS